MNRNQPFLNITTLPPDYISPVSKPTDVKCGIIIVNQKYISDHLFTNTRISNLDTLGMSWDN